MAQEHRAPRGKRKQKEKHPPTAPVAMPQQAFALPHAQPKPGVAAAPPVPRLPAPSAAPALPAAKAGAAPVAPPAGVAHTGGAAAKTPPAPPAPPASAHPHKRQRKHPAVSRRAKAGVAALVCLVAVVGVAGVLLRDFLHRASGLVSASSVSSSDTAVSVQPEEQEPQPAAPDMTWALLLANTDNPLPDGYAPALASMGSNSRNGEQWVDERIQQPLQAMLDAARAAGVPLVVRSAYRSNQQQSQLFYSLVQEYISAYDYSYEQAFAAAKRWRNVPGTSEHETGLSVDLVGEGYLYADLVSGLADTDWAQWLVENAADYGFILRYPADKTAITGTSFEPWHYRYVGEEAAQIIMAQGLCLEEYLGADGTSAEAPVGEGDGETAQALPDAPDTADASNAPTPQGEE